MSVTLAYPAKDIVGESLVWDHRNNRLLWVDIVGKRIHAFNPETGEHEKWATPEFVTSIGLSQCGGAIVGLTKRICRWDFGSEFETLAEIEPDIPDNRLNEGVVGPDGAFWVGTMQNNIAADGTPMEIDRKSGCLYRVTADGEVHTVCVDSFGIPNTFIWTNDGSLITADTSNNEIYKYSYDRSTKRLVNRTTLVSDFGRGLPDGSAADVDGNIWNCRVVGGSCLLNITPEGHQRKIIELPCSWPTSCVFGGRSLDSLYVTSARFTMDAPHLAANPQEGNLFKLLPGVKGKAANLFGN